MPLCSECGSKNIKVYSDDSGQCLDCGKAFSSFRNLPETIDENLKIKIEKNKAKHIKDDELKEDIPQKSTEYQFEGSQIIYKQSENIPWSGIGMMVLGIILFTIGLFIVNFTPTPSNFSDFQGYADTIKSGAILELIGFYFLAFGGIWGLYSHAQNH